MWIALRSQITSRVYSWHNRWIMSYSSQLLMFQHCAVLSIENVQFLLITIFTICFIFLNSQLIFIICSFLVLFTWHNDHIRNNFLQSVNLLFSWIKIPFSFRNISYVFDSFCTIKTSLNSFFGYSKPIFLKFIQFFNFSFKFTNNKHFFCIRFRRTFFSLIFVWFLFSLHIERITCFIAKVFCFVFGKT